MKASRHDALLTGACHKVAAAVALSLFFATDAAAQSPQASPSPTAPAASSAHSSFAGRVYSVPPPSMADTNCPDVPDAKLIAAVKDTLQRGGIVILGEIHDNFLHHMSRACIVDRMAPDFLKAPVAAVFEQFSADQQTKLEAAVASRPTTLDAFKDVVSWSTSGWSQYKYDPLFQSVLDAKLPLYAGDVTRDMIMKTSREGSKALGDDERKVLALDQALGDALDNASLDEIEGAHCGMMPKSAFGGMAFGQRYRDAHIADVALKAAEKQGAAIVFAGSTHARSDRGIAWYIAARKPNVPVLSVAFVEAEDGKNPDVGMLPFDPAGRPAADFVVVTLPVERPDPCIEMREQMKKMKEKK